jgi:hypothetical protein
MNAVIRMVTSEHGALMGHALRHRAQCADVVVATPRIPGKIA